MSRRLLQYHPRIGHTYIPGLRARVPHESGGYLVKTNSSGFRSDRDFVPERTPGLRRALLFGDSSTAGDGVSNSARYSDVLEELTPGLEVYNYGLPGTGTDQQYLAYQDYAGGVAHDVLIIGVLLGVIRRIAKEYFLWNDDQGNVVAYGKPQYALTKGSLVLRNVPVPPRPLAGLTTPLNGSASTGEGRPRVVLRGIAERVGAKHAVRQIIPKVMYPEYDRADSAEWRLMRAILSEWIVCSPAPVIVMPIPDYQYTEGESDPSGYQARFHELAEETGAVLHDPLPDLLAYSYRERRAFRFRLDPHATPAGHRALAESLAPTVQRLLDNR